MQIRTGAKKNKRQILPSSFPLHRCRFEASYFFASPRRIAPDKPFMDLPGNNRLRSFCVLYGFRPPQSFFCAMTPLRPERPSFLRTTQLRQVEQRQRTQPDRCLVKNLHKELVGCKKRCKNVCSFWRAFGLNEEMI